jgi:hypothetical protein
MKHFFNIKSVEYTDCCIIDTFQGVEYSKEFIYPKEKKNYYMWRLDRTGIS